MVRLYALELGLLTSVLTAHHPWRWLKAPDTQDKFVTSSWEQITATELGRVKWGSYPALFTRWSPSCLKCCAHVRPCTPWAAGVWLHLLLPSPDSPLLPAGPPRLPTLLHTCGALWAGPWSGTGRCQDQLWAGTSMTDRSLRWNSSQSRTSSEQLTADRCAGGAWAQGSVLPPCAYAAGKIRVRWESRAWTFHFSHTNNCVSLITWTSLFRAYSVPGTGQGAGDSVKKHPMPPNLPFLPSWFLLMGQTQPTPVMRSRGSVWSGAGLPSPKGHRPSQSWGGARGPCSESGLPLLPCTPQRIWASQSRSRQR